MEFRVPQFIETEDKIVGPLTLRQFGYVGGAGALSFIFYLSLQTWLWFLLSLMVFTAGVLLAFVKIQGRPLPKIILSGLLFYWHPQTYVWQAPGGEHAPEPKVARHILDNLVHGFALKRAWKYVQTGSISEEEAPQKQKGPKIVPERYQLFSRPTGEHRIVKRVDYA